MHDLLNGPSSLPSKATVLLVDDQPVNLRTLTTLLKDDYHLQAVTTGSKALEIARGPAAPDVILLDVQMPEMDGYEVCRRLRSKQRTRDIPVIFITAHNSEEDEEKGLSLGAADYVSKPFTPGVVKARVLNQVQRRHAQKAMQSARDQFQSLVENIPGLTYRCRRDKDWTMLFMSDAVATLTGYPASDFIHNAQRTYASVIHPEDTGLVSRRVEEAVAAGRPWDIEYRIRRMDGEVRWVHEKGKSVPDVDGKSSCLDGFILDITDRMRAEEALAQSEERFRILFQRSPDPLFIWRLDDTLFDVNDAGCQLLGYSRDEILRKTLAELLPPSVRGHANEVVSDELTLSRFESINVHQSGRHIPVDISKTRITLGGSAFVLSAVRDITRQKQAEEKLHQFAEQMEIRNMELDFALAGAEAATRAKSEFLANMSHEIRTPMNGVIGMTGLLLDTDLDATQRRYAETVRSSAESLLGIINDILDFSKVESGKLELESLEFDLPAMLDDFAATLAFKAEEKGLEFVCAADPDVPDLLVGDPGRLRQILTNLAGNAVKFTRQGEVVVRVALGHGSPVGEEGVHGSRSGEVHGSRYGEVHGSRFTGSAVDGDAVESDLFISLDDTEGVHGSRSGEVHGSRFTGSAVDGDAVESDLFISLDNDDCPAVGAKNLSPNSVTPNTTSLDNTTDPTVNPEPLNPEPLNREPLNPEPATVKLRFTVADTGIGIPEDKQDRLFKSFSQVDASTTRRFGGTGLGLAISRQLAELMGGEIGVESIPGQGSTFWFTVSLPLAEAGGRGALARADLDGVRVLIVDDNATNREVLLVRLLSWGMRPDEAPDGPTALERIFAAQTQGDPYQMALLDMLMPGMDGEMLARTIRAHASLADLKLAIMTSAGGVYGDARRYEEAGFHVFLHKPIRHSDLHDSLALALAGSDGPRIHARMPARHKIPESRRTALPDFSRSRARILVAEDNPVNQQVAVEQLRKMGLTAEVAANGLEVLAALQTIPYDLVLMDVQMPEMDGLEATRTIRKAEGGRMNNAGNTAEPSDLHPSSLSLHPFNRRLPVIAMTAGAMRQDREECLAAGMDDHVTKPVNPFRLAEVLERWLSEPASGVPGPDGREKGTDDRLPDSRCGATDLGRTEADQPRQPETSSESPVLDMDGLLSRLDGDEEFVRQLLRDFLPENEETLNALRCSIRQEDAAQVRTHAHFLKGSSLTIGAEAFADLTHRLEKAAIAGDIPAIQALGKNLEPQLHRLTECLRHVIG